MAARAVPAQSVVTRHVEPCGHVELLSRLQAYGKDFYRQRRAGPPVQFFTRFILQARDFGVEIGGKPIQVFARPTQGGTIAQDETTPQQGRSGVARGFGPPSVTRAPGSALPLPGDHFFGMTPGDTGQDFDVARVTRETKSDTPTC